MFCFSFDTDHMNNARMVEFLDDVKFPGKGTFFCTQVYDIFRNLDHEVGPHPYLGSSNNWEVELKQMRENFSHAKGWRSHSCVFSHILAEQVKKLGYDYVTTHEELGRPKIHPYHHAFGVWQMPIFYMDNLDFSRSNFWEDEEHKPFNKNLIDIALGNDGVYVFDFHPVHLLINTPNPDYYFKVRDSFLGGEAIADIRYDGYGTRNFFDELCHAAIQKGMRSQGMQDALNTWLAQHPKDGWRGN